MKLYDYLPSGNSYKVRLLLSYLGLKYTHIPIDIHAGETQTAEYLAMNPAGQIPLLQLAGEGGFDLSNYPHVQAWCARMAEHPKHILITDLPA